MSTGSDFVRGALRKLGVRSAESPIEAFEMSDGIEVMNDMLSEWEPRTKFGFTPIADSADEVRVPRESHDAIKSNLAIRLAPDYSKPISDSLAASAIAGMENVLIGTVNIGDVKYPDTLPVGSGNECTDYEDQRFFPNNEQENF